MGRRRTAYRRRSAVLIQRLPIGAKLGDSAGSSQPPTPRWVGSVRSRLEARIKKYSAGPDDRECILWVGGRTEKGYGHLRVDGVMIRAHRVKWELVNGLIPEGWELDHLCLNRPCINEDHLKLVPPGFNSAQGGSRNSEKSHCPWGHEYDYQNTKLTKRGHRKCKICERARNLARH